MLGDVWINYIFDNISGIAKLLEFNEFKRNVLVKDTKGTVVLCFIKLDKYYYLSEEPGDVEAVALSGQHVVQRCKTNK